MISMKPSEYLETVLNIKLYSEIIDTINREAVIVSLPLGHTVLHEGDMSSCLYLIIRGVVRGYYIDDKGNDITKCFCSENEFFSTEGFRMSVPSTFTIECLEDCQCVQLSYNLLNNIISTHKQLGDLASRYFQIEVSRLEQRSKSLMMLDAEERYYDFCQDYPYLHKRIALKYIASYIGVRLASLSRIRKKQKLSEN